MIDLWVGHKLPFLQIMRNLNDARKVSSGVGNGKPLNPNGVVEIVKFKILYIFFFLFHALWNKLYVNVSGDDQKPTDDM